MDEVVEEVAEVGQEIDKKAQKAKTDEKESVDEQPIIEEKKEDGSIKRKQPEVIRKIDLDSIDDIHKEKKKIKTKDTRLLRLKR